MTTLPKSAAIIPTRGSGFALFLDGVEFPWHIEREPVEIDTWPPDDPKPLHFLRIGIVIDGPITGADEFNDYLADEVDRSRVRRADIRDLAA